MNIDTFNDLKADRTLLFKGLRGSVKSGVNAMDKFATKWISYSDELNTVSIDMEDIKGMVVWFNESIELNPRYESSDEELEQVMEELEAYNEELLRNFPSIKDMKILLKPTTEQILQESKQELAEIQELRNTMINNQKLINDMKAPIVEETIEAPTIEEIDIKRINHLIESDSTRSLLVSNNPVAFQLGYNHLNEIINAKDKVKAKYPSATNRKELMAFAQDVIKAYTANQDGLDVPLTGMPVSWAQDAINKAQNGQLSHWARSYNRLFNWFYGLEYSGLEVFAEGNGKLPFMAFSALPQITCPGLGACLNFCYSFKAFRYPDAFMRQLVNTCRLMSENGRNEIKKAFMAIPNNETVRLYVDGDIDSIETMAFWFDNCNARLDLAVYGYSKSWELFLDWHDSGKTFPANYQLNLSGGSKYEAPVFANIKARVQKLSCVRGEFIVVKTDVHMPREATSKDNRKSPNWNKYQQAVMEASKKLGYDKVFVCPGKCGDCGNKHACGNPALTIPIAIAVH